MKRKRDICLDERTSAPCEVADLEAVDEAVRRVRGVHVTVLVRARAVGHDRFVVAAAYEGEDGGPAKFAGIELELLAHLAEASERGLERVHWLSYKPNN